MKNILKYLLFLLIFVGIISISTCLLFFKKIDIDNSISQAQEIKDLDHKIFWNFGHHKPEKISTDFSLYKNQNDTVEYILNASINSKYNQIGQLKLISPTGFGGNIIDIYKLGNRFRIEIQDYSDNETENESRKGRKILSQKLILDKKNYNLNDSIFGKIQIKFRDNSDNSINESVGFFRGKIN